MTISILSTRNSLFTNESALDSLNKIAQTLKIQASFYIDKKTTTITLDKSELDKESVNENFNKIKAQLIAIYVRTQTTNPNNDKEDLEKIRYIQNIKKIDTLFLDHDHYHGLKVNAGINKYNSKIEVIEKEIYNIYDDAIKAQDQKILNYYLEKEPKDKNLKQKIINPEKRSKAQQPPTTSSNGNGSQDGSDLEPTQSQNSSQDDRETPTEQRSSDSDGGSTPPPASSPDITTSTSDLSPPASDDSSNSLTGSERGSPVSTEEKPQEYDASSKLSFGDFFYILTKSSYVPIESLYKASDIADAQAIQDNPLLLYGFNSITTISVSTKSSDTKELKEDFHKKLDDVVDKISSNSQQIKNKVRSRIYDFLNFIAGDEVNFRLSLALNYKGDKIGSKVGLGHASKNNAKRLLELTKVLDGFLGNYDSNIYNNLQNVTYDNLATHLELGRSKVKVSITDEELLIHLIDELNNKEKIKSEPALMVFQEDLNCFLYNSFIENISDEEREDECLIPKSISAYTINSFKI